MQPRQTPDPTPTAATERHAKPDKKTAVDWFFTVARVANLDWSGGGFRLVRQKNSTLVRCSHVLGIAAKNVAPSCVCLCEFAYAGGSTR